VFEKYGRKSRRELFLDQMESVVPWSGLEARVASALCQGGQWPATCGALRTYFVQEWFDLPDPGAEEACTSLRRCECSLG
jgi:IS5 family transposase